MKRNFIVTVMLSCLWTGCGSDSNGGGDEGPNGGEIVAQQASVVVQDVVARVARMPEVFPEVSLPDLEAAARRVRIIVRAKTFANGAETDATNNGRDLIELNMSRWKRIRSYQKKSALVLHELLGLIGTEGSANYHISSRILVERRFSRDQLFLCSTGIASCTLRIQYQGHLKAFAISEMNCNHPGVGQWPQSKLYYSYGGLFYSSHDRCDEPEEDLDGEQGQMPVGSCSKSPGTGLEWDELNFEDGFRFYFTGVENNQLSCRLAGSAD